MLYSAGARLFVIAAVVHLGFIPIVMAISNDRNGADPLNRVADAHNTLLEGKLEMLRKELPDAILIYADAARMCEVQRQRPAEFGYTHVIGACCGGGPYRGIIQCGRPLAKTCSNPNEYLFWDFVHGTQHLYEVVSQFIWSGSEEYVSPINLSTLESMRRG
eukprot:TRINITY_DN18466_c0_g1_i1.p1 TRINITY_DN18466_c0_g1~~TRINITY_DN18466_c0_g1_i1.p1  ORF type:complete len:161 (-),score=7.78 TRINITY_DN18466_c0_g1_i1:170-652(-)